MSTPEVSKKITNIFNKNNCPGEVYFLVLNQLMVKDHTYSLENRVSLHFFYTFNICIYKKKFEFKLHSYVRPFNNTVDHVERKVPKYE